MFPHPSLRRAILPGIIVGSSLPLVSGASAATLRVPSVYPTIQAAVDGSVEGDSVLVAAGTYRGAGNRNIRFPEHAIVLTSEDGPEATILDIQGSAADPGRGFLLDHAFGPEVVLDGFTIENGWMSTQESRPTLAGAVGGAADAARELLANGREAAAEKHDLSGAGFKVNFGAPTVRNIIIRRCHSEYTGGGASIEASASPRISNISIRDCSAGIQGGGISVETGSIAQIENSSFIGNIAPLGGGLANHATVILIGCTIAANRAQFGGGVALYTFNEGTYERTLIWGNCATTQGDQIWTDNFASALTLDCCLVDSSGVFEYNPDTIDWGDSISADPHFCDPTLCSEAPFDAGDFSVSTESPALPSRSPCGALVGAVEFGPCNLAPVERLGWGTLKSRFLGERDDP